MIGEEDRTVLRDVARVASDEGIDIFVIGAGARFLVHDWPRRLLGGRGTTDWDIAVRVSSWDEFQRLKRALSSDGGRFSASTADHGLTHVNGRRLDLVPFGGVEAPDRTVTYPQGKTTHSVLGLQECEASCVRVDIGDDVSVRVVAPPGLVLLKAAAYLERRPVTNHDVQDLDFLVTTYEETLDSEEVLERAGYVLQEETVAYEDVGAYLLAVHVRDLAVGADATKSLVLLLEELTEPSSQAVDDLLRGSYEEQAPRREAIVRRYVAFRTGLLC